MTHLPIVGSHSANGVSALHTELFTTTLVPDIAAGGRCECTRKITGTKIEDGAVVAGEVTEKRRVVSIGRSDVASEVIHITDREVQSIRSQSRQGSDHMGLEARIGHQPRQWVAEQESRRVVRVR